MREVTQARRLNPGSVRGIAETERVDQEMLAFRVQFEERSPLDEIVRVGAQRMLQAALEVEVPESLAEHAERRDEKGNLQIVCDCPLLRREICTGAGVLEVKQPRVRDNSAEESGRICFTSKPQFGIRISGVETSQESPQTCRFVRSRKAGGARFRQVISGRRDLAHQFPYPELRFAGRRLWAECNEWRTSPAPGVPSAPLHAASEDEKLVCNDEVEREGGTAGIPASCSFGYSTRTMITPCAGTVDEKEPGCRPVLVLSHRSVTVIVRC